MSINSLVSKADFPIFGRGGLSGEGSPAGAGEVLNEVYLDSAATSQKPRVVLEAIQNYYTTHNANVHRGVHKLSDASTQDWIAARQQIASFFGADSDELIMVRNTTEALNGVAYGWADYHLKEGDVIVTAVLEHHANLVTWQQVCARTGARLEVVEVTAEGKLNWANLVQKLQLPSVKLVALVHVSNALGTVNPIEKVVSAIDEIYGKRKTGDEDNPQRRPRVVVDGAQSAPHLPIKFNHLNIDFFAFSGHKMLGPMGSGGLLVRRSLLESGEFRPWLFGGGMISEVSETTASWHPDAADRFTAGTPDVASAVGLAAACGYLQNLGMSQVAAHDAQLVKYALEKLSELPELELLGPTSPASAGEPLDRVGSVAFMYQGVHAHDVAQVLDNQGVAVRSGHHCTMPLHAHFGWPATVRASFHVYTSSEDIDRLIAGLLKVKQVFATSVDTQHVK